MKINNYKSEYYNIENKINDLILKSKYNLIFLMKIILKKSIKSNISKNHFINIVKS